MENIKEYGKVHTSDLLIIGGSMAGLVCGIKAKEDNPDLDVLVVDKGVIGWSGQSTKAGNGITCAWPGQEPDDFIKHSVVNNGEYLNDQEFLRKYFLGKLESVQMLHKWGVKMSVDEKGDLSMFPSPGDSWSALGCQLNVNQSLRLYALKIGVRLLSRVQIFELLTGKDGNAIGGIGFDVDHANCHIFQAKAVCLACNGAHFKKMGGMFMGYGNAVAAAYRAGAEMRNAEFATQIDVVSKATYTPVYGGFNLVHNKNGENISHKYAPGIMEVTVELALGMEKEVKEGRGPLYCDLRIPDEMRKIIGGQGHENMMRFFEDKHSWIEHIAKKSFKYGMALSEETPEVTIRMVHQCDPLRVDIDYKTTIPGLFAAGCIAYRGAAYFGWVRGDGLGNAANSGLRAGRSMATYAPTVDFEDLNVEQIKAAKEWLYAPLNRNGSAVPADIFHRIEAMSYSIDKMLRKTEETINGVLAEIEEMKLLVPELTANDPHTLAKCHEAADCLLCLEMIYRCALLRKESRGISFRHYRPDYPERDDQNWLKWICFRRGKDGEMDFWYEDIPMEDYPVKPEGWVSKKA